MTLCLSDSILTLVVPADQWAVGVAKERVEKVLLWGYEVGYVAIGVGEVFALAKGPLLLFLHYVCLIKDLSMCTYCLKLVIKPLIL